MSPRHHKWKIPASDGPTSGEQVNRHNLGIGDTELRPMSGMVPSPDLLWTGFLVVIAVLAILCFAALILGSRSDSRFNRDAEEDWNQW
jgi:hypothetical protein